MTYLRARAGQVGTKHDGPRSLVIELLAGSLEAVLEQLQVTTTAVTALLILDFVLNDERLLTEADRLGEGGGDGVVGSLGLGYETLVALNGGLDGVFDLPLANIAECLTADGGLLGGLGRRPPLGPIVRELFEEGGLDRSRLYARERLARSILRLCKGMRGIDRP